ncbi:TetR/AcrR family transcriptional regulator [Streptomyces sp. NPDC102270]|uniref:TetR/AcrR family transcriptional regulator n=1 Tax=Streptomyces sp. NPDC102270 TaxID=3366150 RepID=UPI00381C1B8C
MGSLSLRELARDIGVSHAAPGRDFKDKQALLDALALDGFERLTQTLEGAGDPTSRSSLASPSLCGSTSPSPPRTPCWWSSCSPAGTALTPPRKSSASPIGSQPFERVMVDAQGCGEIIEGDPARLTLAVCAALHGTAAFATQDAADPQAALGGIEDLVHLLPHGLQPR